MSFSKFTKKDTLRIANARAELLEAASKRCRNPEELDTVVRAFDFAEGAHRNVRRGGGEPFILHPAAVAMIVVSEIGLGYKSITAALLHNVVESTDYTTDDIRRLFGEKIAQLVDGLGQIRAILDNDDCNSVLGTAFQSRQAENFRRILLTMGDDVRVVLIKLADRLHNCRTIDSASQHRRERILTESMAIFIPLAHRLGLYSIKSEMENIWLREVHPDIYEDITRKVDSKVASHKGAIDEFISPVREALEKSGFRFEIKQRVKTPYSIWFKMENKNVPFEQIYDLFAVRIIFDPETASEEDERDQAYHIYSIVTKLYVDQPSRLRDWIKNPKDNGYEALHCTLMSKAGLWMEVQIRSRRMDDIAEKGIAAHWAYKNDGYISESDSSMDRWLASVQEALESEDGGEADLLDLLESKFVSNDIIVFTPKGEQKTIPNGSTALDFAYTIHSHIGDKAIAAKVNTKLVPLSHVLKAGDQVEIITARNGAPKVEWLGFLKTSRARRKVLEYIRDNDPERLRLAEEMISSGRTVSRVRIEFLARDPEIASKLLEQMKNTEGIQDVAMTMI